MYVLNCNTGIEDKAVLFVDYYLTHVLESLPAFVSQVEVFDNGLVIEGHPEIHIHPNSLRSVPLSFGEAGNPFQASFQGSGIRHASEALHPERRYAILRSVLFSSCVCSL